MLPIINKELCDNKGWVNKEDIADCYAVAQCTPGVVAVNTGILLGNNIAGFWGGIVAAIAVTLPSLVIILIIANLLKAFIFLPVVSFALLGIRAAVCALIFNTIMDLSKTSIKDAVTIGLFLVSFYALNFFDISPVLPIILGGFVGVIVKGGGKK